LGPVLDDRRCVGDGDGAIEIGAILAQMHLGFCSIEIDCLTGH